jgi:hypothetical protein
MKLIPFLLTILIVIFLFICFLLLTVYIQRLLFLKDEIEYDEHGKIKMRGERQFNKRFGYYNFFDNEEKVYLKIKYKNGDILYQEFINTQNGQIWKKVDVLNKIVKIDLQFADELTRSNREMILEGFQMGYIDSSHFKYISHDLKLEREVVLNAVSKPGSIALKYVSDDLKNDREIVLTAVKKNGFALEFASNNLKNDREIVLTAVKRSGGALEYASDDLKNDWLIVNVAVGERGDAIKYCSEIFKNDREIIRNAFKSRNLGGSRVLKYASDNLRYDKNFILQLANENPEYAFELHFNIPSKYVQDNEFLIELFRLIDKKNLEPYRLLKFLFENNKKKIKLQNKTLFFVGKIWLQVQQSGCIGAILGICLGWILTFWFGVFLRYTLIHMLNIPVSNPWVNFNDNGVFLWVLAMLPGFGIVFLLNNLMDKIGWNIYSKLISLRIK